MEDVENDQKGTVKLGTYESDIAGTGTRDCTVFLEMRCLSKNLKGRLVPTLSGLISLMRPRPHRSNQI